jgi:hypothetical protein
MRTRWILVIVVIGILFLFVPAVAGDDPIYDRCSGQTDSPGPWCYQREVEKIGDPELCENILTYWPDADGVHGWCFYRMALKKKDCSLCDRIQKEDIRKLCIEEVCK